MDTNPHPEMNDLPLQMLKTVGKYNKFNETAEMLNTPLEVFLATSVL